MNQGATEPRASGVIHVSDLDTAHQSKKDQPMMYRSFLAPGMAALAALAFGLGAAQAQGHGWRAADWPAFDSIEGAADGALDVAAFRALIDARMAQAIERRDETRAARRAAHLDALVAHVMEGAEDGRIDAATLRQRLETLERLHMQRGPGGGAQLRGDGIQGPGQGAGPDAGQGAGPRAGRHLGQRGQGQGAGPDPDRMAARLFGFFDADNDGAISQIEYDAAVARLAQRAEERGRLR